MTSNSLQLWQTRTHHVVASLLATMLFGQPLAELAGSPSSVIVRRTADLVRPGDVLEDTDQLCNQRDHTFLAPQVVGMYISPGWQF